MARFYSKGDCNSHQTKAEKKKVCENWCVYNSSFSPPILLTFFVCTAMRNVQGRTGNGTRVRLNARTTGAVHSHFQYDIYTSASSPLRTSGLDRVCTIASRLVCPCGFYAVHMHALRLLYILVPYVCDVSRPAPVCSYATLCYTHVCARLALLGHFPSNLHILLSIVYVLFGICRRDSHIAGVCCTIAVRGIEQLIEYSLTYGTPLDLQLSQLAVTF